MRVSAMPDDPGYPAFCRNRRVIILLDGDPQRLVRTADEERGFLVRLRVDDRGRPIFQGGDIVEEIILGKVEIRRMADAR